MDTMPADPEDRRHYKRYPVNELAVVALGPYVGKIGPLKDISRGGLSFEYTQYEESPPLSQSSQSTTYCEIIQPEKELFISKIPCQIVYESQVNPHDISLVSWARTWRCGILFGELSPSQVVTLASFHQDQVVTR